MASRSCATNTEAVVPSTVVGLQDGGSRSSPFCNPCFGRVFLRYDTTHRAVFDMFLHVFECFRPVFDALGSSRYCVFIVFLWCFCMVLSSFMVVLWCFCVVLDGLYSRSNASGNKQPQGEAVRQNRLLAHLSSLARPARDAATLPDDRAAWHGKACPHAEGLLLY